MYRAQPIWHRQGCCQSMLLGSRCGLLIGLPSIGALKYLTAHYPARSTLSFTQGRTTRVRSQRGACECSDRCTGRFCRPPPPPLSDCRLSKRGGRVNGVLGRAEVPFLRPPPQRAAQLWPAPVIRVDIYTTPGSQLNSRTATRAGLRCNHAHQHVHTHRHYNTQEN